MSSLDWKEILGWESDKLDEIRMTGYSYVRQGRFDIAQTFFEALIVLDPNNAYDQQTLGAICLQRNDPIRALQHLEKALEYNSEDWITLINQIKALFMLGFREEGLRLAKQLAKKCKEKSIKDDAEALILAYG